MMISLAVFPNLLLLLSFLIPPSLAQTSDPDILNAPQTYQEALVGTDKPMLPVAGGKLIDAGTVNAIRGLDNLVGPYLGSAPDAGAYELGLGIPWTGPRQFTNLLAYGVLQGWKVAPPSILPSGFRLRLVPNTGPGEILATFEELQGEARWTRYDQLLQGNPVVHFRDGLGAAFNSPNATGARVDDEGVLKITGTNVSTDDFSTFIRSLTYPWYLQDPQNPPINLTFVTPPAPGVIPIGNTAAPSTSNAVVPGILGGDVTIVSASILWEVEGDEDKDATATVQFRRQGTSTWKDGFDLTRVKYQYGPDAPLRNNVTGSLFGLSPGTTYEVRVILSDPDGGGATRTTTFTTREMPKMPADGRFIEVRPTDAFQTMMDGAQPGDTYLLHAGNYGEVSVRKSGTRERPILIRSFGDDAVAIPTIYVSANYVWLHGLAVNAPDNGYGIRTFDINNVPSTDISVTGTTIRGSSGCCAWFVTRNVFFLDNTLIGPPRTLMPQPSVLYYTAANSANLAFRKIDPDDSKGGIVAFNESTGGFDAIKSPSRAYDIHGNKVHEQADDSIEPDYSYDNARIWENLAFHAGHHNISFQPQNGGPWYFTRNQFTGAHQVLKMRSDWVTFFVANTAVSSDHTANSNFLFQRSGMFANNYWKAFSRTENENSVGEGGGYSGPNPAVMRLWGYNRYDAAPCRVWNATGFTTIAAAQVNGAEAGTLLVNDPQGTAAAQCGGGGGGENQTLTANNQTVIVRKNTPASIALSGSPSGTSLTFALGQSPSNGVVSSFDTTTGRVTYTPNQGYEGNDSFTFTVSDGKTTSLPGTVTLRVVLSSAPDAAALVGHWKFDETSGGIALDSSGKNNNGSVRGGPLWTTGKIGGAIQFDGIDDYVRIPDSDSLDITKAMTISAWVNFTDEGLGGNVGSLVVKSTQGNGGNASANETYALFIGGDTAFSLSDGRATSQVSASRRTINDGQWHHVVALWDGTTNVGSQKLYMDGNEVASAASTITGTQPTTHDLFVNTPDTGIWEGLMDDTCIFNRALSEGEILWLASGTACDNTTSANQPPTITTSQIPSFTIGQAGSFTVTATDPEGDAVTSFFIRDIATLFPGARFE